MRVSPYLYSIAIAALVVVSVQAQDWVQWDHASGGNGHSYKAVINTNNVTWTQADQLARNEGGHLATISSDAENQFVFSLINSPEFFSGNGGNGAGPAIGGYQPDGEPSSDAGWAWETGEPWTFSNWAPGQPDVIFETRAHYWSGTQGVPAATWNNLVPDNSNLGGYVIERDNNKSSPSGFYGQVFAGGSIGTVTPPIPGVPAPAFVTVYDSKGKMVGRVPTNPVGQFYAYEKPGNYTLVATHPAQGLPPRLLESSPKGSSVTVPVTVSSNILTAVQINFPR